MQTLYIIGNGFDCYAHDMPTQYSDFRNYLVQRFPDYQKDYGGILSYTIASDGAENYDMNEVVGAIIRTIDECSKPDWGDLEACLGENFLDVIAYENEWAFEVPRFDGDDDNIFHSVYDNEDISRSVIGAYEILKLLFTDWSQYELSRINYHNIRKLDKKPSFKKSLFLNFNYTRTLERVYGIGDARICHIHGDVGCEKEDIYFGHGNDEEFACFTQYIGIEDAFSRLKYVLKKDTKSALERNAVFFNKLSGINKIYSFGFSFSAVDMIYIEEIVKKLDPHKVRWYFNAYDWVNNRDYVETVKSLGFKVRKSKRW